MKIQPQRMANQNGNRNQAGRVILASAIVSSDSSYCNLISQFLLFVIRRMNSQKVLTIGHGCGNSCTRIRLPPARENFQQSATMDFGCRISDFGVYAASRKFRLPNTEEAAGLAASFNSERKSPEIRHPKSDIQVFKSGPRATRLRPIRR